MPRDHHDPPLPRSADALTWIVPFFNSDFVDLALRLWRLGRKILSGKSHEGMYEVLYFEARLELKDREGKTAWCYKRERVKFLQDNIIAFQDKVWGDGNIFAEYRCSPGLPVDRYREGHRYRILISLRETKQRGDVEEFNIERRIERGFTRNVEEFQSRVDQPTRQLSLAVVFPKDRPTKNVWLIEQNSTRTIAAGPKYFHTLPDGREQVIWRVDKPRLFEGYTIRWSW